MRFSCFDITTKNCVFRSIAPGSDNECEHCLTSPRESDTRGELCQHGRYFVQRTISEKGKCFCFCMRGPKTRKKAKYFVDLAIEAYLSSQHIALDQQSIHDNATELAVHNTRNLHASINTKLLSLIDEDGLFRSQDKIQYIQDRVEQSLRAFAREILSIMKSLHQISSEYSIIDFMNPAAGLHQSDFQRHKIHTLCVMGYYLYEHEFQKKKMFVQIGRSDAYCDVDFSTAQTAISQLLDNCLKYCKQHSTIDVSFVAMPPQMIEMRFSMTSLLFEADECNSLTLPGQRGKHVGTFPFDGKGAGMAIIQRMMELNQGYFKFSSNEKTTIHSGGIPYSCNEFVLGFRTQKTE